MTKQKQNQKVARAPLQFETHIICIKKQAEDRLINRQNDTQGILYCLQDLTTSSQPSTKQLCSKPAGCQHKQKGAVQASASLLLLEQEQVLQLLPSNIAALQRFYNGNVSAKIHQHIWCFDLHHVMCIKVTKPKQQAKLYVRGMK